MVLAALFVFWISGTKQNARSLLTLVSGPTYYALSHGSLGFALHGSFFYHFFIGIQQPIRIFEISGYLSCHGEQNGGYRVKEHRKLYQKQVSKVTLPFV